MVKRNLNIIVVSFVFCFIVSGIVSPLTNANPISNSFVIKAEQAVSQEKYDLAIELYTKAIKDAPNNASALLARGDIYCRLKQYKDALEDYNTAILLDTNNAKAYDKRARFYELYLNDDDSALKDLSSAIKLNPYNDNLLFRRSWIYNHQKHYDKALEDLSEAIRLAPEYTYYYFSRAETYANLKQYENAIIDYTYFINYDEHSDFAYGYRGDAYVEIGQYEKAIEDYTLAMVKFNDDIWNGYFKRARVYLELKKFDLAINDFTHYIDEYNDKPRPSYYPSLSNVYLFRGMIYDCTYRYPQALKDYKMAITLDPKNQDAIDSLKNLYKEMKSNNRT